MVDGLKAFPSTANPLLAVEMRKDLAGLLTQNADGTVRGGVLSRRRNVVTTLATRQVGIGVHHLARATDGGRGVLLGGTEAFLTLDIDPAPAAGTSRLDAIWGIVNDTDPGQSNGNGRTEYGVVAGDPHASSPQLKAIPAGAELLAQLLFPSGASTAQSSGVVLTEMSRMTALAGVTVELRSQAQMDAFSAANGQRVLRLDTGIEYVRESTGWVPVDSSWIAYTPAWTAAHTAPSLGSNGSVTGRYRYEQRKVVTIQQVLTYGSNSQGGREGYRLSLPAGMVGAGREQVLLVKALIPGIGVFQGLGILDAGASVVRILLPASATASYLGEARSSDSTGAAGTGIPVRAGAYTFTGGANIVVEGTVEIA